MSTPSPSPNQRTGALHKSLRLSVIEGMAAEIVSACAGGGVLTGYALFLGCSPALAALVGSLPMLSQAVQLPSAWLTYVHGSKPVALIAIGLSRQALLPLVFLPLLPVSPEVKRGMLLVVASLAAMLGVAGNNAWTAWLGALVPKASRGRFFARRTSLAMLSAGAGALITGLLIDSAGKHGGTGPMLAGLALVACLAGALTTALLARHPAPPEPGREPMNLQRAMSPLKDQRARPFLTYQFVWNGAIGVSAGYVSVFMLKTLHLSFTLVAISASASLTVRALLLPVWGRIVDRYGSRPVLIVCSFGLWSLPLIWLTPVGPTVSLGVDVLFAGAFWAGHGLASFQLPLTLAPEKGRSFYLATFASAGGLGFAAATAAGGLLAMKLPAHLELAGLPLQSLQVLFILSALGRLVALPLALLLKEDGARPVPELLAHARGAIGGRARSIAGLA